MDSVERPGGPIEYAFTLFGLLLAIGALQPIYMDLDPRRLHQLEFQLLSGGVYFISLVLLYRHREATADVITKNKGLLIFLGFVLLSSIWAQDSGISFRRSMALAGTTIFAIYVSVRFPPREFCAFLAATMLFVICETVFVSLLVPSIGVHSGPHDGAWRGVFGHKNEAGRILVLAALSLWVYGEIQMRVKAYVWAVIILCLGLIILTQSATSMVVMLAIIFGLMVLRLLRRSSISIALRITLVSLFVVLPIAYFSLSFYQHGLDWLGRDTTLTGRTTIWERAIEVGMTRPWFGFGYRTFWLERGATAYLRSGHGHNSFLDLWLELGFVGAGLFAVTYVTAIRRALWRLTQSRDSLGLWYILFLLALTLFSMTSQVFPQHGTIEWVLYVSVLMHLAPRTQSVRTLRAAPPLTT